MEQEPSKVHDEEEKALPDKNSKRKIKTKAQLQALENFYNEHKYPLESMKLELAEKIGLTEKQVSGWFCHRRLKDKRISENEACLNGRLDRSSGVIQDHGSAPGQDSCGSTKPREYKHVDTKEVDSRMLCIQDIPSVDHMYDKRSRYEANLSDMDDTSSDRDSGLQDIYVSQGMISSDIKSARNLTQNGSTIPVDGNITKNRPSGYLKLKGNREHVAIAAVKRQLGRHYRQDGPTLGIDFEPLPPCAFEAQITEIENEPYRVNDPIMAHPPERSGARKHHLVATAYEVRNSKIKPHDSFMEHENIRTRHSSNSQDSYSHRQVKHSSSLPKYYSNSSMNASKGSAEKNLYINSDRSIAMRSKHDADALILNSIYNTHIPLYDEKITDDEQTEPYLHQYENAKSSKNVRRREILRSKPSISSRWNGESLDMSGEESTRRIAKDENLHGGRNASREYHNSATVNMNPTNDSMDLPIRVRDEYPQHKYVKKASYAGTPSWANPIKRSLGSMPSTHSEDETEESSGSMG